MAALGKAAMYMLRHQVSSILRLAVLNERNAIKDRLFTPETPVLRSAGDGISYKTRIDVRTLLTESLTYLILLDPQDGIQTLIPLCLSETSPMIYKLSLIRSIHLLINQSLSLRSESDGRLPWGPHAPDFYTTLSRPLRRLFIESAMRLELSLDTRRSNVSAPSNHRATASLSGAIGSSDAKKASKAVQIDHGRFERQLVVLKLLQLYLLDPKLAVLVRMLYPSLKRYWHD